ncbi:MAG: S8 family serine peptidase, partial [Phycisphaerales bacterium]|nr:S8 family serine peptidase [Phycisphaerales bacterium]
VLQSQSNNGSPDSRPEAWAKNVISVGGVQGRGTLDRGDDAWAGYASTGPALDGRIKPDMVMFNDGIWAPADGNDTDHRLFTGTSAATPAVAGHLAIMLEMWDAGLFAAQAQARQIQAEKVDEDEFIRPSVAMAKALMINSARPYGFEHVAEDLGRYRQGWGTPDLRRLRDDAGRTFVLDEREPLIQGGSWAGLFEVAPGEPDLRVTLVYDDPAGLPMAASAIVNDLDLRLTSPSGVVYHGNAGLHNTAWSSAGGVPDRVNTVENILIENPAPGPWLIGVHAHRVNEDADDSTPEFDVPFALVAAGAFASEAPVLSPVGVIPGTFPADGITVLEFDTAGFTPEADGVVMIESDAGQSSTPLVWTGGTRFVATLADLPCGSASGLRFRISTAGQATVRYPPDADGAIPVRVTDPDELEPIGDWETDAPIGLGSGWWEHGTPSGGGLRWDPPADADGDGVCWLTDNRAGLSDVSGGSVTLVSPVFDLHGVHEYALHCDLWVGCDDAGGAGEDTLAIDYSADEGATWSPLIQERATFRWVHREVDLTGVVAPGSLVRFRFTIADNPDDSITEAAVDGLRVVADRCAPCPADSDSDGDADLQDLHIFSEAFLAQAPSADFDEDGDVDL